MANRKRLKKYLEQVNLTIGKYINYAENQEATTFVEFKLNVINIMVKNTHRRKKWNP